MGFLGFLKPKKGMKGAEQSVSQQLPPLPSESDFYSELPTLPEAPEMPELPEIELPQPTKDMEDLSEELAMPQNSSKYSTTTEKTNEKWLKSPEDMPEETKVQNSQAESAQFYQADKKPTSEPEPWLNIPSEVPELKPFQQPEEHEEESFGSQSETGHLISKDNAFFLRAEDFRMVRSNLDKIVKANKKHHTLTDLKKEEGAHYERIDTLSDEMQRKLTHIDKTLFD